MRSSLAPLMATVLVSPLLAQIGTSVSNGGGAAPAAAAFTNFGSGCNSSGWSHGTDVVVPATLAASYGNANNNIPFSWSPTRYQQSFAGTEIGAPILWTGMALRQDDQFSNYDAHKIDLAVWLGGTTYPVTGITTVYDNNFNSTAAPKTLVFQRRWYALPRMPAGLPSNPANFFIQIPFDLPYIPTLASGENLVVEVINYGNTAGNAIFTYPLDAGSGVATTRLYGFPDTVASGTLGSGYGHVIAFKTVGGASPAVPRILNSNLPQLGKDFHFELLGAGGAVPGALFVGASNTSAGSLPLPFDLTIIGMPGCFLLVSAEVALPVTTNKGGDLAFTVSIPNNPVLVGGSHYLQYVLKDSINTFGFVTSNGGQLTY